mmetsp:Transcript_134366/g.218687  ORF Transcript_134366/g.218687 Transcript_134366/m.218687 type:complete len:280 (+) Transcript_134366:67-906(+)
MRAVAVLLASLACAGHSRRLQNQASSTEEPNTSDALAKFLLAFNSAAPMRPATPTRTRSTAARMLKSYYDRDVWEKEEAAEREKNGEPEPEVLYSEALPFLTRRASLGPKGYYAGDRGFDPLGFTEFWDIKWFREAEIKHARIAMLAFVGFAFTDFYHLPGFDYTTIDAHDACVASGAMSQLLLWIGVLEWIGFLAIDQMIRGSGREPGDFGFDPLGFATDPEKMKELQEKEIANGRLAMFAFGGAVTQAVLTGNTFPWLYGDAVTAGSGGDFAWNIVP